jgi:hypothetical protein
MKTPDKIDPKNPMPRSAIQDSQEETWTEADRTAFASIRAAVQPGAKKAINHNMTLQEVLAQEAGRHGA